MTLIVGQYVHISTETGYVSGYVQYVFDDHAIVARRDRRKTRFYLNEKYDALITFTKNGNPVLAKKNIFGRWTFKPQN